MQDSDLLPQAQPDPLHRGAHLLFVLVVTVGLTLLGIGVIAVFCQLVVPPIPHTPEFLAQYTVLEGFFYAGQPAKTAAYQASCVATPFLVALSFWFARRWVNNLPEKTVNRINVAGIVVYLVLMILCALPIVYCPNPPFWILPPSWLILPFTFSRPFYSPGRILLLLMAAGAEYYFLISPASRRNANRALAVLLTVWALLIPSRFYPPSEINDEPRYIYHLNSVLDALSQSVNGHHLLVDFPHIYGGYIEILAPIIRLFPREIGTLIASLAIPNILGMLSMLLTARLVVRRPAVLFLCGLTLLSSEYLGSCDDLTYGYVSARLFLVPVSLLAATFYFRHPETWSYTIATVLAALSSVWNLDTGIVFWVSWLGTLLAMAAVARDWPGIARHLLVQVLTMAAIWIGFFLYLRVTSGQWPDISLLFYFQTLVVGAGYFCLRLLFPDMWVFVLTLYVTGLAAVFCTFVRGKGGWITPVTLMISLLGIGIFSYFMGRSAPSNLLAVAYPAVLLAAILCSEGEILMERKQLPPNTRFFLLPSRIALVWWTFLMVAALPDLTKISARVVHNWPDTEQTPLRANVAFVKQHVQPHEEGIYFLSNHSGLYYYLSDTVRTLKIPGTIELLRSRDMNVLLDAIRQRRISKLFVEQNFFGIQMYRGDIYDNLRAAIDQNYQVSEAGPTGLLVLYTPK